MNAQSLPGQQRELLGTAVISLKSIWNILNNMDKSELRIVSWFNAMTGTTQHDPLLRYFKTVRDMDLKEGVDGIRGVRVRARQGASVSVGPDGFTFRWPTPDGGTQQVLIERPANAISSIMGDGIGGGMGFEVRLPDGSIEMQYVRVPAGCAQVILYYPEAPLEHLGARLDSNEAEYLLGCYHAFWQNACKELRGLVQSV